MVGFDIINGLQRSVRQPIRDWVFQDRMLQELVRTAPVQVVPGASEVRKGLGR
jgi:hypothetical protein